MRDGDRTSHVRCAAARVARLSPCGRDRASRRVHVTHFSVEHSRRNAKHFAVLVAGLRRILLAELATLRVTLRVCNFLSDPLKTRKPPKWRLVRALVWAGRRGSGSLGSHLRSFVVHNPLSHSDLRQLARGSAIVHQLLAFARVPHGAGERLPPGGNRSGSETGAAPQPAASRV